MYVKGCSACQQNKASRQKKATPLNPHTPPESPWESISLDVIGLLPESNGFNAILSVIDRFSKMICLIPTTTELSTKGLTDIYLKQIWKLHGIPKKITSDRGPQFTSELMKELCTQLGIQQNLSTIYHPQTNGQVERSHQETETFLRHYVNHLQDDWEDWLAIAEYQYNNKIHSSTGHTPFYLNYGRHPWKGEPNNYPGSNDNITDFLKLLDCARKDASASTNIAAETTKQHYDL